MSWLRFHVIWNIKESTRTDALRDRVDVCNGGVRCTEVKPLCTYLYSSNLTCVGIAELCKQRRPVYYYISSLNRPQMVFNFRRFV